MMDAGGTREYDYGRIDMRNAETEKCSRCHHFLALHNVIRGNPPGARTELWCRTCMGGGPGTVVGPCSVE